MVSASNDDQLSAQTARAFQGFQNRNQRRRRGTDLVNGITDDFGFAGLEERTSVHDLHATILHLMGFDHEQFTYQFQGRPFRLTDVHGELITKIMA